MRTGTKVFHSVLKVTGEVANLESLDPDTVFVFLDPDYELLEVLTSQLVEVDKE